VVSSLVDQRIEEHAKIVVKYSCEAKRGDTALLLANEQALPLIKEIASEIGKAGARLIFVDRDSSVMRASLLSSDDETISTLPQPFINLVRDCDPFIQIISSSNSQELSDVPPNKMMLSAKASSPLFPMIDKKRWNITLHPTPSLAQDAKMSLESYSNFVYSATLRDWPKLASQMQVLSDKFSSSKRVKIVGKETDISFSIENRKPIVDDAKKNLPGGEVFISPVDATVNGKVYFDLPINYMSQEVKGVRLLFRNGEILESSAEEGEELLKAMLSTDAGAKRLGELGIGMNRGINRFTKNILFDEKMGDTIHMAVGRAFPDSGGTNQSGIHIDMIKSMKDEGAVYFDEAAIYKDGKFAWE
jgi:aminopeptidase